MPKTVLVIDPVPVNRIRLAAMLEAAHYAVSTASDASESLRGGRDFDLVVIGLLIEQAPSFVQNAITQTGLKDVPVLCLDSDPSPLRRLLAMKAGARDVLSRSAPDGLILARLRGLLRDGEAERECDRRRMTAASFGFAEAATGFDAQCRIACVGLPEETSAMLQASLPHKVDVLEIDDVLRDGAGMPVPDAYVLASEGDGVDLNNLLPEIRDRSHSRHAPVLVLHAPERPDIATHALALGANDIAVDVASGEELDLRINAMLRLKRLRDVLRRSDEQSYRMAATDPLTGLYNRRYAEAYLGDLFFRAAEHQADFALIILDLDHFKSINDRYGHTTGDAVLQEVAYRLRDNLRACDLVSRHGGEEFLIILPETDQAVATHTAERLRKAIGARPVRIGDDLDVPVTASLGVAIGRVDAVGSRRRTGTTDVEEMAAGVSIAEVFDTADAALYRAKMNGRNRVELSGAETL